MKNAFWGCLTFKIMFWKINFRRNLVLGKRTIFTVLKTQIHNPKSALDGDRICIPARSAARHHKGCHLHMGGP